MKKKAKTVIPPHRQVLLLDSIENIPRSRDEFVALAVANDRSVAAALGLYKAWLAGEFVLFAAREMVFVSRTTVLPYRAMNEIFERELAAVVAEVRALSLDRDESLDRWLEKMTVMIRDWSARAAFLAIGLLAYLDPLIVAELSAFVSRQLAMLEGFYWQVLSGTQPIDGNFVRRSGLYALQAREMFGVANMEKHFRDGYAYEQNFLGLAEHCGGCVDQTARGVVPIGTLVPVGLRDCLSNCKCTVVFYRADEIESD